MPDLLDEEEFNDAPKSGAKRPATPEGQTVICPFCGARVVVDPSKELQYCPSCKMHFKI